MPKRWTKLDPSRTKTLRQRFLRDMKRRLKELNKALYQLIVTDDAFGLETAPMRWADMAAMMSRDRQVQNRRQYAFMTNPQKIKSFQAWLQQQIDRGLLAVVGGIPGKPWTAQYVESAWRQGMMRSYTDMKGAELQVGMDFYSGKKEQWLRSAFLQPEMMSKVEMLSTRAFEGMRGITSQLSTQLSRVLADGLVNGYGMKKIARLMSEQIGSISRGRALAITRTEIIHAHAVGQLDGLKALGVDEVTAEVEWSTAGDGRVCQQCESMQGKTFKIDEAYELIPAHTNCRCAWLPVVK